MGGDYTRWTFNPAKDYAELFKQQGRVDLDADWNEFVEIVNRRWRAETMDIIGRAVVPTYTTPNAFAILDIIAEAKVPLLATVGTQSVVEPVDAKKRWVFKTTQNDDLIAAALLKHMVKNNVKTVGFIGFNDPYGENWYKVFGTLAEKAGIRIIASERYARADQSVMGQVLKLIAAKPDAILIAAVGGPAAGAFGGKLAAPKAPAATNWSPSVSLVTQCKPGANSAVGEAKHQADASVKNDC